MPSHELEIVVRRAAWKWFREQVANFARKWIARRQARRAMRELETMTDRELRDIGLQRADIERSARSKPRSAFASSELRNFDSSRWWLGSTDP